jgi:peptidoglycan/LPS O-acetylase OafA/YrhL
MAPNYYMSLKRRIFSAYYSSRYLQSTNYIRPRSGADLPNVRLTSNRNPSLDVLRCIAVLMVLGFHYPYFGLWSKMGWIGVDLFFVLSGYLISGLLFREYLANGSLDLKRFLIRRGLKIYPSFYLLIVLTLIIGFVRHSSLLRKQAFVTALFAQSYYPVMSYTTLAHTWSIAIEEHFYLLLPLLFMFLIDRKNPEPFRILPGLFAFLAVACLALRWFTLPALSDALKSHLRIDTLFAGVTLGYLHQFRPIWFRKLTHHYSLALALLFCLPAAFLDQHGRAMQTFGLTGLMLGFSFLVAWSVVRNPRKYSIRIACQLLATIGFYSYSIYLWHTVVGEALFHSAVSIFKFCAYIVVCIICGIVMSQLIEIPYLLLREKYFPSRTSAVNDRPNLITDNL